MPQNPPKRILIINIFGIGDVLFTTPLMSNIKLHNPGCYIGYVCNKRAVDVLKGNTGVDRVFVYEKDDYRDALKRSKGEFIKKIFSSLAEIKQEQFDCVIDLSLNKYASILMGLIGIKRRIGFNYRNRSLFLTEKIKLNGYEGKHVVDFYLSLLKHLDIPIQSRSFEFAIGEGDHQWAKTVLERWGVKDSDILIGLVPGGGASWGKDANLKRWPAEKYAKLADKVVEKYKAKVILLGDISENELCASIRSQMRREAFVIAEPTSIQQFAALLKRCRLIVLNDGGPLHIAVAAGVKTVSIFGPVDENVYGPYPKEGHAVVSSDIACRPCYRQFKIADCEHYNCLRLLDVEHILERVGTVL